MTLCAQSLIDQVTDWAKSEQNIVGAALVGSYARDEAKPDSDIDLVIIALEPCKCLNNTAWIEQFGEVSSYELEDWGLLTSVRVFMKNSLENNLEIEFGFSNLDWVTLPADEGTAEVVKDGLKILYDPQQLISKLHKAVYQSNSIR